MNSAPSTEGLHDLAREFRLPMTIYTTNDRLEPDQAIDPRMICIPVEDEDCLQVSDPGEKSVRDFLRNMNYMEIALPRQFLDAGTRVH